MFELKREVLFTELLTQMQSGSVLITGAPGIGKSWLIGRLLGHLKRLLPGFSGIRDRLHSFAMAMAAVSDVARCVHVFHLPFAAAVILCAPAGGILPSAHLPTSEGAAQIAPSCITGVSQKENPALPASAEAASQPGFYSQNRT
jgi:hypothetical protein